MSSPSSPQRTGVSLDRATSFPFETMTDHQRRVFRQFLDARRRSQINETEPIWVALFLTNEKPAVALTSLPTPSEDDETPTPAEALIDVFDLRFRKWSEHSFYVTRTAWRLALLPSRTTSENAAAYARRLGCFFGYPQADIEHFIATDPPDTQPKELVTEGVFSPKEIAYTTYLPYRHEDSTDGFERAIDTGKSIRATVNDCATMWELPELAEYAEWLYETAVTECSP